MNDIPTPRTDELDNEWNGNVHLRDNLSKDLFVFARTLERELFTTREQLLESESARNRNFQSASEAMETVAKLSAKLEATEKDRDEAKEIARDRDARVEQTQEWAKAYVSVKSERDTALAELARRTTERDGALHSSENWELMHAKAHAELSRLRAENAAKDAALQQWMAGNAHAEREEWDAASAHYHEADRLAIIALSAIPPVGVPVEVVAKLVEALEAMHRGSIQNGNTRESSDIIWAGHKASKEARALAAPFLAKVEQP